jgi:hypothetical protein
MPKASKASEQKPLVKQVPLDLPADFVQGLDAYCEASDGAPRAKVIRRAVTELIQRETHENPGIKRRYDEALARMQKEPFSVVPPTPIGPKTKKDE